MAKITFNIDDNKLEEFKSGFLIRNPTPIAEEGEPQLTDNEWIKEWGRLQYIRAYRRGKRKLAEKTAVIEEDLIT